MKKLLVSATAFTLLTVGYNSSVFAAQNPNDKDCGQFKNNQEVMEFWHSNGYNANNDPHDLDRDNDGLPCEVNKGEYDRFVASKQTPIKKETNNNEVTKKQAEKLPNTASNNMTMMLVSTGLILLGSIFVFRRKKTDA
ncbi:excalibur calcium-binding domain-containing protein [Bacillus arachidis]|uniref:Excalibur calcium-binding domain-containing protein n=1 Tax=Bacillus arachidis TaxID=2819290 RepID=A0ABS3P2R7_9BACI|nr:excalibur calcium-binding domain-containing protein [Bacillus arachidis]MBO1627320.1 excalibur calcium-binding domain-containing protein [Bacillus arachidis]